MDAKQKDEVEETMWSLLGETLGEDASKPEGRERVRQILRFAKRQQQTAELFGKQGRVVAITLLLGGMVALFGEGITQWFLKLVNQ